MASFREGTPKNMSNNDKGDCSNEDRRRKKIEMEVHKRMDCEQRAFNIVEKMVENPVTEESLLDDAQHITPSHYDDIVEERAIAKMCGYPLCRNSLGTVPKQKYHISTRSNKVYDITARKNFCSNQCFRASQYFRCQLSTVPLWAREGESAPIQLQIIPQDTARELIGEEVMNLSNEIHREVQSLQKIEKYEKSRQKKKSEKEGPTNPDQLNLHDLSVADNTENKHPTDTDNTENKLPTDTDNTENKLPTDTDNTENKLPTDTDNTENKLPTDTDNTENKLPTDTENTENKLPTYTDKTETKIDIELVHTVGLEERTSSSHSHTTSKSDTGFGSDSGTTEDKLKYLQTLLDRRKNLLGQVADIRPMTGQVKLPKPSQVMEDNDSSESALFKANADSDDDQESEECLPMDAKATTNVPSGVESALSKSPEVQHVMKTTQGQRSKSKKMTSTTPDKSVIVILCGTVKEWVTMETIDLLTPDQVQSSSDRMDKMGFQSKYDALCQRIDQQDNDLDDLIGQSKVEDLSIPQGSVPHYKILKEETDNFSEKVGLFLQGKTSTSGIIKEKATENQSKVYMPTVDSHDQTLIRRRIVMEKLNKSMPDILTPLNLCIQDMFSEIRSLVSTFSLSSQTVTFRPAEWTLVSLILLIMLARRQPYIAEAFKEESAVRHFDILLHRIGESLNTVNEHVSQLLLT